MVWPVVVIYTRVPVPQCRGIGSRWERAISYALRWPGGKLSSLALENGGPVPGVREWESRITDN